MIYSSAAVVTDITEGYLTEGDRIAGNATQLMLEQILQQETS